MNRSSAARPSRGSHKKRNVAFMVAGALVLIGIIAGVSGGGQRGTGKSSLVDSVTAVNACAARPSASGDIYVRTIAPGAAPETRRLGGGWRWDQATGSCLTGAAFVIATSPRGTGHCTQVGYVSDNPRYNLKARPAPPLSHVAAHVGPACTAPRPAPPAVRTPPPAAPTSASPPAATSVAVTTPPAPEPPAPIVAAPTTAPAPTTQASCYPLSDEGTCYRAGEFCRDDDHGMSGIAANGEPITCKDNDGWRWEPA